MAARPLCHNPPEATRPLSLNACKLLLINRKIGKDWGGRAANMHKRRIHLHGCGAPSAYADSGLDDRRIVDTRQE
jgi:hypothetical protein